MDCNCAETIYDSAPELVEKHFPKGQCKERGEAIVLVAELICSIKREIRNDECM